MKNKDINALFKHLGTKKLAKNTEKLIFLQIIQLSGRHFESTILDS